MSDVDTDLGVDQDVDAPSGLPPVPRGPSDISGEYRDRVNYWMLSWGVVVIGIFLWIDLRPEAFALPSVAIFMLLFPLVGLFAVMQALNASTLGYDQSGWRYRREILGLTLETEDGRWSDIYQTGYRQWAVTGRGGMAMFGEFSLLDAKNKAVLKARTCFYPPSATSGGHTASKRLIGLSEEDFWSFVRVINDETPQLSYEWAQDLEHAQPPRNRLIYADAGPARYVAVPRGTRVSGTGVSETRLADPVNLPTPF